jgi:diadenosine tetraphosphatase ApaH/serine/threonine PP2A family protein phosphatase
MLLALISDIHGNDVAFRACLAEARRLGAEQVVFLGDFVGYGAEPEEVVRRAEPLVAAGAVAVRGNHDHAIDAGDVAMNAAAAYAIAWTRRRIGEETRRFLASLPLTVAVEDRLYVHADASDPAAWNYVIDAQDARASLMGTEASITFCGHTHVPALFCLAPDGGMETHATDAGMPVTLTAGRRWLAVIGSAGQPRDANPAAAFATYDTRSRTFVHRRALYDVETAAAKILDAGLPTRLAARLLVGW